MTSNKKNESRVAGPLIAAVAILLMAAWPLQTSRAQNAQQQAPASMPGMSMGQAGNKPNADEQKGADMAMSDHDMKMGGHMFMTDLRPTNAADQARAAGLLFVAVDLVTAGQPERAERWMGFVHAQLVADDPMQKAVHAVVAWDVPDVRPIHRVFPSPAGDLC